MRIFEVGDNVFLLRFLPDGRRLLAGRADRRGRVRLDIWPRRGGKPVTLRLPNMYLRSWRATDCGNPVAIHPSGTFGYVAWAGRVSSFHTSNGRQRPVPNRLRGSEVVLSSSGDYLATGHFTPTRKEVHRAQTDTLDGVMSFEEKRRTFKHVVGYQPESEQVITLDDGVYVGWTRVGPVHPGKAYQPQLSPDGRHLGVLGQASLYLYDLAHPARPRKIGGARSAGELRSFAFHPAGKTVAVIHGGPTLVKVYDLATLKQVHKWDWKLGPLRSVAYSPDGTVGAAGSDDGRIAVWDVDE
jgi:WD40 repeat protein